VRFTVLGSGTPVPDPDRGPAGFLLEAGGRRYLVDGGSGTLQRCARAGVDPTTLDGGFYSHRHPDHCADLVPLLFAMRVAKRARDYPIWAGAGFQAYYDALAALYGRWAAPGSGSVRVTDVSLEQETRIELPDLVVRTAPAVHSSGAVHLRFEADGASVVFSGDTAPSDALIALADGVDLLVCECAGPDHAPVEGHMYPAAILDLCRRARPRELWITHLFPETPEAPVLDTLRDAAPRVRRASDGDGWTPMR
jgi:ribonuclease BN (tRNA processing enzyme)